MKRAHVRVNYLASGKTGMSVQASHILVKHQGSRNPTSWKDAKGTGIRVRTREQAHETLNGFIQELKDGNKRTFAEIAAAESDCGSAKSGGDLGVFGRGEMQEVRLLCLGFPCVFLFSLFLHFLLLFFLQRVRCLRLLTV
jgi:NIMA-interacting peptidyl-prolyl cis-trans isomerase 1